MKALSFLPLLLLACLVPYSIQEESFFKMRVYQEFIHSLLQQNLRIIFRHTERMQVKDIYLQDIESQMFNVRFSIRPIGSDFQNLELDLFFDEDTMLFEMHDLEFKGDAIIQDPATGRRERIEFVGPVQVAKVVLKPTEELDKNRNMFPRFDV